MSETVSMLRGAAAFGGSTDFAAGFVGGSACALAAGCAGAFGFSGAGVTVGVETFVGVWAFVLFASFAGSLGFGSA
jgi:hypothetical protein